MPEKRMLTITGCCASFFWRYAWINFITLAVFGRGLPLAGAFLFFLLSFALSALLEGRGLRLITVVIVHLAGFCLLLLGFLHAFYDVQLLLLSPAWIPEFFSQARSVSAWMSLLLLMLMTVLFCAGGINMVRRRGRYTSGFSGFDIGITAFFLLFLVKFIIRAEGGSVIPDSVSLRAFFLFFISGISGNLLSKQREDAERGFSRRHKGIGVLISFAAILAIVIVSALLFMPLLNTAAETGFRLLRHAASPLGNLIVRILRFLLAGQRMNSGAQPEGGGGSSAAEPLIEPSGDSGLLEVILGYLAVGLIGLIVLLLSAVLLWALICRLLKRTDDNGKIKQPPGYGFIIGLIEAVFRKLRSIGIFVKSRLSRRRFSISEAYIMLLKWGSRGGLSRRGNETPDEYKTRLSAIYPFAAEEIRFITERFNEAGYGGAGTDEEGSLEARRRLRKLRNPALIPLRIMGWFRQ